MRRTYHVHSLVNRSEAPPSNLLHPPKAAHLYFICSMFPRPPLHRGRRLMRSHSERVFFARGCPKDPDPDPDPNSRCNPPRRSTKITVDARGSYFSPSASCYCWVAGVVLLLILLLAVEAWKIWGRNRASVIVVVGFSQSGVR